MNKLCRYNGILTVLVDNGKGLYYTFPIEDYDIDIPITVKDTDVNVSLISVAKLHFSEARRIINSFISDYEMVSVGSGLDALDIDARTTTSTTQTKSEYKPAFLLHGVYDREP